MTCEWYKRQLANENAELWHNGRPSAALLEHARSCASCNYLVYYELELKLLFTELQDQVRSLEPNANVKNRLLAEISTLQPQPRVRRKWNPRFAWAVAAVLCLVIGTAIVRRSHPTSTITRSPMDQTSRQAQPARIEQGSTEPAKVAASQEASPRSGASLPGGHARQSVAEDFYPIVMCDSITCSGPTVAVRVELPSSPLTGHANQGPVLADLLVGEDGLVRGVRVLQ